MGYLKTAGKTSAMSLMFNRRISSPRWLTLRGLQASSIRLVSAITPNMTSLVFVTTVRSINVSLYNLMRS